MEVSLAVTQETTYEVEIHGGFNYQAWLLAGRVSETFDTLDEILADEPTLRQLFLVHDSVDYICDTFSESATSALADITKIFNTDLAAKWINLSDYALDHFYAVDGIKSIMDTADKYGYGEWTLMPQVPKMMSNTAPYGEASADTVMSGSNAYYAFDGDNSTAWVANVINGYLTYTFTNPVCVKEISFIAAKSSPSNITRVKNYSILASNDNFTTSTTLHTGVSEDSANMQTVKIDNDDYYLSYRFVIADTYRSDVYAGLTALQFYAWAPKGNVPVMTANNAPYGEASASSTYNTSRSPWVAFGDKTVGDGWTTVVNASTPWLRYKFTNPVNAKKARVEVWISKTTSAAKFKIQGSNDGSTFVDVSDEVTIASYSSGNKGERIDVDISTENYYLYYQIKFSTVVITGDNNYYAFKLQFYGRELKVSVPTMTSNTAPFGEARASTIYSDNEAAWKAFDGLSNTGWYAGSGINNNSYVQYEFTKPVLIKYFYAKPALSSSDVRVKNFRIEASNDNFITKEVLYTGIYNNPSLGIIADAISNDSFFKAWRFYVIDGYSSNSNGLYELQFYGLDYSEKEFEVGTTKKWLYDHGVELETLQNFIGNTGVTPVKNESSIICQAGSASAGSWSTIYANVDISDYTLLRVRVGDYFIASKTSIGAYIFASSTDLATYTIPAANCPNSIGLNISNVNQECDVAFSADSGGNGKVELKELWLE